MGILAIPKTLSPGELTVATNIRVVSMSIAAYDYLLTIPLEYRLYRSSDGGRLGLILFILIRYISAILIVVSNVGFFSRGFSPESCGRYFYVIPVFKLLQTMVSQAILGIRAYNIARRNVWVGRAILLAYFIVAGFQWQTDLFHQRPVTADGNCMISNADPRLITSIWAFYMVAMLYDFLVLSISTVCLLKMKSTQSGASASSQLVKMLLYDGLGYFIVVTAVNATNILMHRGTLHSIQTAAASLGNAITWITSQRILIHPREARTEQKSVIQSLIPPVVPSTVCHSGGTMSEGTVNRAHSTGPQGDLSEEKDDGYLQVRIERSIVVNTEPEDGEAIEDLKSKWGPEHGV